MVFNNSNPSLATQVGVCKGPWVFPASDGAATVTFNVDDLTGANVLIGSYAAGVYSDSTLNGGTGWFGDGANALELAARLHLPLPFSKFANLADTFPELRPLTGGEGGQMDMLGGTP